MDRLLLASRKQEQTNQKLSDIQAPHTAPSHICL